MDEDYTHVNLVTKTEREFFKDVITAYQRLLEFRIKVLADFEELIEIQNEIERHKIEMKALRQTAENGLKINLPNRELIDLERENLAADGKGISVRRWLQEGLAIVDDVEEAINKFNKLFVRDQPVKFGEDRFYEFKEITGKKPGRTIADTVDEYAVAFLNTNRGQIYWGIRNSDKFVVGVQLQYKEIDEIRRKILSKLNNIQPLISPTDHKVLTSDYTVKAHPVYDNNKNAITNLFVIEVIAPQGNPKELYALPDGSVYLKTDDGKQKLSKGEIEAEFIKRQGLTL